jgi:hypothetical protein
MRSVLALFALLALAAVAQASLVPSSPVLTSKTLLRPAANPEWCPTCVSFMDQVPPAPTLSSSAPSGQLMTIFVDCLF